MTEFKSKKTQITKLIYFGGVDGSKLPKYKIYHRVHEYYDDYDDDDITVLENYLSGKMT